MSGECPSVLSAELAAGGDDLNGGWRVYPPGLRNNTQAGRMGLEAQGLHALGAVTE